MGMVAGLIAGCVGLVLGVVLAFVIGINEKKANPDASFLITFFTVAFVAVPALAAGAFFLIFWFVSETF